MPVYGVVGQLSRIDVLIARRLTAGVRRRAPVAAQNATHDGA
jgi:hypothetical protein